MAKTSIQINKEQEDLNNTLDRMNLTEIHKRFYPTAAEYTFFLCAHETCSHDHMLGHQSSPNKFKKMEIIPNIFYNCNEIRYQQQKEDWKIHKYSEIKQHT